MARTLRYRRKRGMTRRRGVTKRSGGRRRLMSSVTPLVPRHGPVRPGSGRSGRKRRVGQVTPANIRVRKRLRFGNLESKTERNGGFYTGQLEKYAFKFGRKRSIHHHLRKLDKRNASYIISRFGAVNRFTDANAVYELNYRSGTDQPLPLYLLEVDVTSSSVDKSLPVMTRAYFDASSNIQFAAQPGRLNNGSSSTNSMTELKKTAYHSTVDDYVLEWISAKFLFKCPKARPGYVKVMLVQFTEANLSPNVSGNFERTSHYQRLLKECLYSPIVHETTAVNRKYHNGMRVLRSWTKNFSPDSKDNEASYAGQQIRLDLFCRLNRYCNRHLRTGFNTGRDKIDDDAYIEEDSLASVTLDRPVDPRSRVYLMIMGTNFDAPASEFDAMKHISFDLEFRNKQVFGGSNS